MLLVLMAALCRCARAVAARDLFLKKDLGSFTGSFSTFVNPTGVVMLRLKRE